MISTRGRYALRVMIDLAEHEKGQYIPLKDIAARQELSKKYLEIIVKDLVRSHLIIGTSGKGGGYKLSRPPEDYTVGEIIELMELWLLLLVWQMEIRSVPEKIFVKQGLYGLNTIP